MPRIRANGKEYKINNPPRGMHLMTVDWKARMLGLTLEEYNEINEAIARGEDVEVLKR